MAIVIRHVTVNSMNELDYQQQIKSTPMLFVVAVVDA
jgi:hypothetical protein